MNPYLFILLIKKFKTQLILENNFGNRKSQIFIKKQLLNTLIYSQSYENIAFLVKIKNLVNISQLSQYLYKYLS